jgi:hypothetical protein
MYFPYGKLTTERNEIHILRRFRTQQGICLLILQVYSSYVFFCTVDSSHLSKFNYFPDFTKDCTRSISSETSQLKSYCRLSLFLFKVNLARFLNLRMLFSEQPEMSSLIFSLNVEKSSFRNYLKSIKSFP